MGAAKEKDHDKEMALSLKKNYTHKVVLISSMSLRDLMNVT